MIHRRTSHSTPPDRVAQAPTTYLPLPPHPKSLTHALSISAISVDEGRCPVSCVQGRTGASYEYTLSAISGSTVASRAPLQFKVFQFKVVQFKVGSMRSKYLLSLSLPTERLLRSESLLIGAGDGDALSTEPKYHIRIREIRSFEV